MTAELMHRHRSQLGVLGALKHAVFKNNNDLGVAHKYKFGAAYCHSRVLFHCAVWSGLSCGNQRFLETAYLASMRAAMGYRRQEEDDLRAWSTPELYVACRRLPPLVVLQLRRL
eukprot:2637443-Pyramimonas_sp.AAC.1